MVIIFLSKTFDSDFVLGLNKISIILRHFMFLTVNFAPLCRRGTSLYGLLRECISNWKSEHTFKIITSIGEKLTGAK